MLLLHLVFDKLDPLPVASPRIPMLHGIDPRDYMSPKYDEYMEILLNKRLLRQLIYIVLNE